MRFFCLLVISVDNSTNIITKYELKREDIKGHTKLDGRKPMIPQFSAKVTENQVTVGAGEVLFPKEEYTIAKDFPRRYTYMKHNMDFTICFMVIYEYSNIYA